MLDNVLRPLGMTRSSITWDMTFLLEFLNAKPASNFRLNEASRRERLRPQMKTRFGAEGIAWNLEEHEGVPRLFAHSGSDAGYYCFAAASMERRSGLMVMLNGDAYVPFPMKLLANPSGPAPTPQTIWPDFARRFFAA